MLCTRLKSHRSLLRHNNKYHNGRQFTCTFSGCGQSFNSRLKKNNHKRIHNSSWFETYTCVKCGQTLASRNKKRHMESCKIKIEITSFPCDKCDFETKYRNCLKRHKISKHVLRKLKVPKPKILFHKCSTCNFQSKYKYARDKHEKIHERPSVSGREESTITFLFI